MKLYIYEHCPFCLRTRIFANYKKIDLQIEYLAMSDVETPTGLIGKKMAPILERKDGSYMGESLDIINYLDNLDQPILDYYDSKNLELIDWISRLFEDSLLSKLLTPELVKMDLPEFYDQEDIDYMINKFQKNTKLTIEEAVKEKSTLMPKINDLLEEVSYILVHDTYVGEKFSIDDVLLFPKFIRLSMIPDIKFPKKVAEYANRMSLETGIPLYNKI